MVTAPTASSDEIRDRQWHLDFLNIAEAHQITRGGDVVVAVVDSGVDAQIPDLRGNVLSGTDHSGSTDGRVDEEGHGTRMGVLIAGHGHGNGDGILGIAPEAKILPVRVENRGGAPEIADGIRSAADHGAKVINVSLDAGPDHPELREAVGYAQAADAVVVGSAGNSFEDQFTISHPAAYPGVIAVSAVGRSGNFLPEVSVEGEEMDLAGPGKDIPAASKEGEYGTSDGTSSSAALVSGTAALVRAEYPDLDAANVINRLIQTATDKGPGGQDPQYGYGIVNPVEALTADVPAVDTNPLGSLAPEPTPTQPATTPGAAAPPGDDTGANTTTIILVTGIAALAVAIIAAVTILLLRHRRPATPATPTAPWPQPGPQPGPHQPPPPPSGPQPPPRWPPPPSQT